MKIPDEYITLDKFRKVTKDLPGNTVIVLSIDEEGNEYKIACDYNTDVYFDNNTDPVDMYDLDEIYDEDKASMLRCIVLWPIG